MAKRHAKLKWNGHHVTNSNFRPYLIYLQYCSLIVVKASGRRILHNFLKKQCTE